MSPFVKLEAAFREKPEQNAAAYAQALMKAGRAKDAVLALEKLNATTPLKGQARLALARALFDVFRIDDAAALLDDMPGVWQGDAQAQRLLAEIALEREQKTEARTFLRKSFELDPRDARTRELMVFVGELDAADLTSEAMTDEATVNDDDEPEAPPAPKRGLARALRAAVLLALVLAGIVFLYAWRVKVQADIAQRVAAARPFKTKGDWHSLERADKMYKDALALDGSHPIVLGALTEIHALLFFEHGIDASKAELAQWLPRVRDAKSQTGDRYLGEGLGIVIAGDAPRAEALLLGVLERGGVDARVLFALGIAQRTQGKYLAARDSLRRAYELDPYQPTFAVELGDTFLLDSDVKNAEFYWRKAAEANPEHARAVFRAGIGKILVGDDAKVDEKRDIPPAHRGALLAYQAVATRDSQKLIREAKGLRPYDYAIDWLMAQLLSGKEALAAYDVIVKKLTGLKVLPVEAAYLAARLGKPDDGEQRLKAIKDFPPARVDALSADMYLRANDVAGAQTRVERALKAEPNLADAHYVAGRIRQSKHELKEALQHYSKALEARGSYPEVYYQVGLVYVENKEPDRALEAFLTADKQFAMPQRSVIDEIIKLYDQKGDKTSADRYRAKRSRK